MLVPQNGSLKHLYLNSRTELLPESYFLHEDVVWIAQDLLGKILITDFDGRMTSGIIVESEAYRGVDDKACHAYRKKTKRTSTMYEKGGRAYVYLCYGIHHLFNVVTSPIDVANAVLIRAVEPLEGLIHMQERRGNVGFNNLTNGPGKLSQALGIEVGHDRSKLFATEGTIRIEQSTTPKINFEIERTRRIGIDYAEECKEWLWRFTIKDSPWLST